MKRSIKILGSPTAFTAINLSNGWYGFRRSAIGMYICNRQYMAMVTEILTIVVI